MKKHLLFLAALIFPLITATAQSAPPTAESVLQTAFQQASREHKNIFIVFHASWCGWCHQMDSIMNSAACKKLFETQYVIRHLDVLENPDKKQLENPGGGALMKKYHGDKQGIPYWLIFDGKGTLLADSRIKPEGADPNGVYHNSGCPATKEEVAYFVRVLKRTSRLQSAQLTVIAQNFSHTPNRP